MERRTKSSVYVFTEAATARAQLGCPFSPWPGPRGIAFSVGPRLCWLLVEYKDGTFCVYEDTFRALRDLRPRDALRVTLCRTQDSHARTRCAPTPQTQNLRAKSVSK